MSSDRPSESLEAVRAYFEFESTQEFRVLRRYIKLTLRKRKINKTEDDGGPWSKLLDELQEHLPLRASEKIKTEKDEVRRHLSFLAQRALQLLAKSEAKKARKAQRKLEQRLLNTMNSSQGANGYLLLGTAPHMVLNPKTMLIDKQVPRRIDQPAKRVEDQGRVRLPPRPANYVLIPKQLRVISRTTLQKSLIQPLRIMSAHNHTSLAGPLGLDRGMRSLDTRVMNLGHIYLLISGEGTTSIPMVWSFAPDSFNVCSSGDIPGDMADQIKDEGEGSQVNPQKRTSDWPDIRTSPSCRLDDAYSLASHSRHYAQPTNDH